MATEAQKYVAEHGAPTEVEKKWAEEEELVTQLGHWNGRGRLAPFAELEPKLCQKYRLLGEECCVVGYAPEPSRRGLWAAQV